MANRYWVGGTASWDGTAGTKWAATSGGPGGETVPTTADDVFFNASSSGTVTIAAGNTGAKSINCTGFTGTLTGSAGITVAGSITLVAGMTYTHSNVVTITGTGTLITAGKTFSFLTINAAGITLTLGDALAMAQRTITVTSGGLDTAGYNVTCGILSSTNSNTRSITLGSSTVTLTGATDPQLNLDFTTPTNLTFSAGTSTISLTTTYPTFSGGGQTFYNVSFTASTAIATNPRIIRGSNTFNNLTFSTSNSTPLNYINIENNQTVNGTFTVNGFSGVARAYLRSDTSGTSRTITANSISSTDCDFSDITIAGSAAGTSLTRAGDALGNSGITFPAPKTVYRVGSATSWGGTSSWALNSGAAGSDNNFPLPQDTATIDNAGTLPASISVSGYNMSAISCANRTSALTLNYNAASTWYGSFALGSGITVAGTSAQTFVRRSTIDFTSAGKTITFPVIVNSVGGTFRLLDNTTTSNSFTLSQGTLNLNGLVLTSTTFASSNTGTRTLAFGAGSITVSGTGTVWNTSTITNLTITGTPVVNVSNNTATSTSVSPGSLPEPSISFNFAAGTYSLTLTGSSNNLNFTGFAGTLGNATRTIYGNLTLSTGMTLTGGTLVSTFASTSGTPQTIRSNGKTMDFPLTFDGAGGSWKLLDALTIGSTRTLTHTNGTIDLAGFTLSAGASYTTAAGIKNLTFNGGTLTCPGAGAAAFNNAAPTNFTITAGTGAGTISLTSASAKTFVGGGSTYNCTINQGGAGALTITGSNTFTNITNTYNATGATTILFTASTTSTFTNWNANGASGKLLTIGSVTAANHTLSKASGTVSADYLSISRSTATGGATWYAGANSTDGGNNSGWIFTAPPSATNSNFFIFM